MIHRPLVGAVFALITLSFWLRRRLQPKPRCARTLAPGWIAGWIVKPASRNRRFPNSIVKDVTYGWVEDYAYFYDKPERGARHVRTATTGFFYGPAVDEATDPEGNTWYKVWGYWLPARYYHLIEASDFGGVEVNRQPLRPFGWVVKPVVPSAVPGEEPAGGAELPRYTFVQIVQSRAAGGVVWHDIGDEQWVRHDTVAIMQVRERPGAVDRHEFWVEVDLTEQTFAAYEGDRMVFAGLVSSGLNRWATRQGLNQVWERRLLAPMQGGVVGDDYYYIDDVAHSLYYDGEIALHGAFWHDDFGRQKSHGCVNMAPRTAEWVYEWSENAPNDLWVWVHYANIAEFLQ